MGVLDAMPSSNLKPESEDVELEGDRIYRTTYMFSATMPPSVERLARKCGSLFYVFLCSLIENPKNHQKPPSVERLAHKWDFVHGNKYQNI